MCHAVQNECSPRLLLFLNKYRTNSKYHFMSPVHSMYISPWQLLTLGYVFLKEKTQSLSSACVDPGCVTRSLFVSGFWVLWRRGIEYVAIFFVWRGRREWCWQIARKLHVKGMSFGNAPPPQIEILQAEVMLCFASVARKLEKKQTIFSDHPPPSPPHSKTFKRKRADLGIPPQSVHVYID